MRFSDSALDVALDGIRKGETWASLEDGTQHSISLSPDRHVRHDVFTNRDGWKSGSIGILSFDEARKYLPRGGWNRTWPR